MIPCSVLFFVLIIDNVNHIYKRIGTKPNFQCLENMQDNMIHGKRNINVNHQIDPTSSGYHQIAATSSGHHQIVTNSSANMADVVSEVCF